MQIAIGFFARMKVTFKCFLFIIACMFAVESHGQLRLEDISMGKIPHKKIRQFIEIQIKNGKQQFNDLHSYWSKGDDLAKYSKKEMSFVIKGKLPDVWSSYLTTSPTKSWEGKRISFSLLLQKSPNSIYYFQDSISGIDTGQVYFLNLKLMFGVINIPVAFEIITVENESKIIEFGYLEGNKSLGVQRIKFIDSGNENIQIVHTSWFKSNSGFRDKWIYPFFHKRLIKEFHRNMRKLLAQKN